MESEETSCICACGLDKDFKYPYGQREESKVNCRLDQWDRGIHAGLVGDVLVENRAREGRVERRKEEEEYYLTHSFSITVLSGKLRQTVRRSINCEGGCLLLGDVCTKTRRPVADVFWYKHHDMCVPPLRKYHVNDL